jgi:hypothetical protein
VIGGDEMYYIYYEPKMVQEGHTGQCVNQVETIEEAFLESNKLKAEANNVIVLKEVTLRVELNPTLE